MKTNALLRENVDRAEMERAFCANLSEDELKIAYYAGFEARRLWLQRDICCEVLIGLRVKLPFLSDEFEKRLSERTVLA